MSFLKQVFLVKKFAITILIVAANVLTGVALAAEGTSGHIAELQLHITDILAIKELSHISYEIGRGVNFA